ncbi:MAG TPA: cytochrome C [Campylobacterales bacterium]|nr:cytochrome C [Campylobacterales bacterium]
MKTTKFLLLATLFFGAANASEYGSGREHYIPPVTNKTYIKECGSCHMAYQPALLNKSSWQAMTNTLSKHFGVDASLEPQTLKQIEEYLAREGNSRSQRVYEGISSQEWFVKEHRKIARQYITQPSVKSIANCAACHTQAANGDYRERNIMIPGYGRWKD